MNTVWIALGSNMDERMDFLRKGKEALENAMDIAATSPVYDTEPIDTTDSARFLNAVISARTNLSPKEVLSLCLDIEERNGRTRQTKNAPRTLDLDLLLYNNLVIDSPDLTLPHPRMHERTFVLMPLADINPHLVHPVLQTSIQELLMQLERNENFIRRTAHIL